MGTYVVRVSKVQSVNQLYGAVVANVCCESNISAWPVLDGPFVPRSAGGGRCRGGGGGGAAEGGGACGGAGRYNGAGGPQPISSAALAPARSNALAARAAIVV